MAERTFSDVNIEELKESFQKVIHHLEEAQKIFEDTLQELARKIDAIKSDQANITEEKQKIEEILCSLSLKSFAVFNNTKTLSEALLRNTFELQVIIKVMENKYNE